MLVRNEAHPAAAHGRKQRGCRGAADRVERGVGAPHPFAHLLPGLVEALVGTQAEHEVAVARRAGADRPRTRHQGEPG